jgi:hypothetical protein
MKKSILPHFTILIAGTMLAFACNKNNSTHPGNDTSSDDVQTQADDQSQASYESDAVDDDANTVLYSQASLSGNASSASTLPGTAVLGNDATVVNGPITNLICDATITVNVDSDPRTVTMTYNGTNCRGNRSRTGVVEISIPSGVYWKDAGAAVTITVKNLKITRVRDNKSIVLNGVKTITNVSGGLLVNLSSLGTITHTISADNLSITFDNGSQRTWHIAKQRVFTYDNGIVITTTGIHTDGTNTGVSEWGTNRFGVVFTALITQPKIIRQDCDFRLTSGQNVIIRNDNTSTITYGLNANGEATSCPGTGTYYFKVVWTGSGGVSFTKILPY